MKKCSFGFFYIYKYIQKKKKKIFLKNNFLYNGIERLFIMLELNNFKTLKHGKSNRKVKNTKYIKLFKIQYVIFAMNSARTAATKGGGIILKLHKNKMVAIKLQVNKMVAILSTHQDTLNDVTAIIMPTK